MISEWIDGAYGMIRRYGLHYEYLNSHYWDAGLAGQELGDRLSIPHFFTPHSLGVWKRQQMETDFPEDRERFDNLYNLESVSAVSGKSVLHLRASLRRLRVRLRSLRTVTKLPPVNVSWFRRDTTNIDSTRLAKLLGRRFGTGSVSTANDSCARATGSQ